MSNAREMFKQNISMVWNVRLSLKIVSMLINRNVEENLWTLNENR